MRIEILTLVRGPTRMRGRGAGHAESARGGGRAHKNLRTTLAALNFG